MKGAKTRKGLGVSRCSWGEWGKPECGKRGRTCEFERQTESRAMQSEVSPKDSRIRAVLRSLNKWERFGNIPLTKRGQAAGVMIQISLEPVGAPTSAETICRDPGLIDLVRRAQREDAAAQAELMQRFQRRIAGYVRSILRQPEWEEDATQTVFIKMFRQLPGLREPAVFESWLFRIARNAALDFRRRRACRPVTVAMDEEAEVIPAPAAACGLDEIHAALEFAIAQLNPLDRRLVRGFVGGTSYDALARRTGLSLSSVKVRLHRVRPYLRDTVGGMTGTRLPEGRGWRPRNAT